MVDDVHADILEIFSSVQGEGPFAGIKQVFIRFYDCNMKCRFCDVERKGPAKKFSVDKLVSIVKQLNYERGDHHSVSLTGGEPLLYKDYLKELLPKLKTENIKIYLDTNGTLPEALSELVDFLDIIAVDLKLPSATGQSDRWEQHRKFLDIARRKDCFVKVVITGDTKKDDIHRAIDLVQSVDKELLLVLQPVWPARGKETPKAGTRLLFDYLFLAEKKLKNVRIMPQMHKVLGIR